MQLNTLVARGRAIAAGRMLAGLDQEALASEAGLSPSTVSRVELGRRAVRPQSLHAIRDALERRGIDLTLNDRTGHHAAGTSFA